MANQKKVFEVKWKIEKLSLWLETRNDTLYSPQFLTESLENTRWKLSLSPNWQLAEKYITLALQRDVEDDHTDTIDLNYELSFLANDESPLKSKIYRKKFEPMNVSDELNVKQNEIFKLKEAYLPEDILTISCKMWKITASISKAEGCLIKSVIGTKSIIMQGIVNAFLEYQTVNFTSTSVDISLISLDVYINRDFTAPKTMTFETKHVDSKHFSFYTCELFLFTSRWKKKPYAGNSELCKLLNPNKKWTFLGYNFCNIIYHTKRDILTLQLEITYTPAVVEENIEYECQKSSSSDQGIETCLNTSDPENVHLSTLNYLQASDDADKPFVTQENSSAYEENCFAASSMGHVLSTSLKQDLTTLHGDQLFCDTKLQTDTETFPAHRCVLSARSPVFKKMFTTDMKEKAGESINIPDISSDTIRRMLQFLYTDCTGVLDLQSAKDLYIASDKYDIATLKQLCSFFMKKNLCSSNVCEILVLADMHQDKDLESAAQEYVVNDDEVFNSDEWKLFMQNYSAIAARVMYLKCMKK